MPVPGGPVALRRIVSYRLVLGTALITALAAAAMTAALASFAGGGLRWRCTASSRCPPGPPSW